LKSTQRRYTCRATHIVLREDARRATHRNTPTATHREGPTHRGYRSQGLIEGDYSKGTIHREREGPNPMGLIHREGTTQWGLILQIHVELHIMPTHIELLTELHIERLT